ncbi:MAG TPA: 4'-phosphopantetheinyl transferase superfamily protein [Paraburkholderia sp.]|nr:4'-phosphopantetheinyl transferase superfamily protein [Paraburkholderia sp.]
MPLVDPVPLHHDGPPDIGLWRLDLAFDASLDDIAFNALSDDERARAHAFRRHEDALRFATVRLALRHQLAEQLGTAAYAIRFALDANHRPRLADSGELDFNVSHAGAHGLIALSRVRRVGVDIEERSSRFDWRSITALTLDASEAAWIDSLDVSAQTAAFYDAWVAKEALVKTTGAGIAQGLRRLTVLPRDGVTVKLRHHVPKAMRELSAQWIAASGAYAACLAWSSPGLDG